jgi:hypothetical protein
MFPPPATATAEGAQFNGALFPASATAEGAQFNVPPSLWERALSRGEGLSHSRRPLTTALIAGVREL